MAEFRAFTVLLLTLHTGDLPHMAMQFVNRIGARFAVEIIDILRHNRLEFSRCFEFCQGLVGRVRRRREQSGKQRVKPRVERLRVAHKRRQRCHHHWVGVVPQPGIRAAKIRDTRWGADPRATQGHHMRSLAPEVSRALNLMIERCHNCAMPCAQYSRLRQVLFDA